MSALSGVFPSTACDPCLTGEATLPRAKRPSPSEPAGSAIARTPERKALLSCPHCGGGHLNRNGFYKVKDGTQRQRFRCCNCGRSSSPNTGTPEANLKKLAQWCQVSVRMAESLPLRQVAKQVGIHLSTAFRWRHRWLAARCNQPQPALAGPVTVTTAFIPYSEKGSRVTQGPGSWGYWDYLRHRSQAQGRNRSCTATRSFKRFIHGRPACVLLVQNSAALASCVLGQGQPTASLLEDGLRQLVSQEAAVFSFSCAPFEEACRRLTLDCRDGWQVLRGCRQMHPSGEVKPRRPPLREPESPHLWLRLFRGVATRYLHHYMTWFSIQISRPATA